MASSILADGPVTLVGVPELTDVHSLARLLARLGVDVQRNADGSLRLETVDAEPTVAAYGLVRRMRASFCALGPLVSRRGRAMVSLPGGCNIGTRPVDLHLKGLAALGADIRIERGYVIAEARRLRGAEIDLGGPRGPTVTGTANVMSAATLARGKTVLRSAATEPEIVDLGRFLNALGADITGLGTQTIEVAGVEQLGTARHRVIPDRIESGTLLIAAAITAGQVTVEGVDVAHLNESLDALAATGASIQTGTDTVTVHGCERPRAATLAARPYPGVPTDLQAQFMALLCLARGRSRVSDAVFPNRFLHAAELNRLGARITRAGATAAIAGVPTLSAAPVQATDLRASAALVLAGLAAEGTTVISQIGHLDRGYERLDRKLASLGADIARFASASKDRPKPRTRVATE
jgi:UDP-N-acetylglucosamine 1-carboxyvinyltransferase